ncbi:hypothetical protein EJ110_NYTH28456 [Nymphaea thermarum]|nr:hypothetical protein EJ110_NYTH28456 [Nymphaea thermarum]
MVAAISCPTRKFAANLVEKIFSRRLATMGQLSATASEQLMNYESQYSAHNELNSCGCSTLGVITSSKGHCHPKVVDALIEQAKRLTLSSRAFYNDKFPVLAEYLSHTLGYDMVLPMNTGAEGVETAIKLARKWGYEKKNIPKNELKVSELLDSFLNLFKERQGYAKFLHTSYNSLLQGEHKTLSLALEIGLVPENDKWVSPPCNHHFDFQRLPDAQ